MTIREILIQEILKQGVQLGATDIMIAPQRPPFIRVEGEMQRMPDYPELRPEEVDVLLRSILRESQLKAFDSQWELDCSYELEGTRFRVNMHYQRNGMGAVFRVLQNEILDPEKIGLQESVLRLTELKQGLVLVTGPTGSGKTTTLGALIHIINREKAYHILTIEDPIEIVHEERYRCVVTQRELGTHTKSFDVALRAALRENPDVILVGEMRDLETIQLALRAAETGHLVFSTLHTRSASETITRIVDVFPAGQQPMIRAQLAGALKAVISQKLLRRQPKGLVAAREVLLGNTAVWNLIRSGNTHEIYSFIQASFRDGMVTMERALADLFASGQISYEDAYLNANEKTIFEQLVKKKPFERRLS